MWLRAAVIVLSGVLVYANGLSSPFLFDDENSIVSNSSIREVWPPSVPLTPPRDTPVAGRPLVNLTFAFNYAASGLDVRAYRIVNLGVHLLSALVLFGIIRRTLLLPKLKGLFLQDRHGKRVPDTETQSNRGQKSLALNLSCACALVWTLHPLNTEAVNYLSQRTELLMGLFYLLTLYCAIRGAGVGVRGSGVSAWEVAAIGSCMAGMACKESMVTAPVIVALYDRVFLFDSVKDAFRQRWRLYAGLAVGWLVLAALMFGKPRTSTGFGSGVDPWVYFLNQIDIIVTYLRLSVWPRALVLDYGLPLQLTLNDVVMPAVFLIALGLATIVAVRYWPLVGFLGAWFFIILSPTSSFVPIATEVGAERRMYLPLAGLVVLAVVGVHASLTAWRGVKPRPTSQRVSAAGLIALAGVCVLLAIGTVARNREYQSRLSIAQTIVDRHPHGRAHFQLGAQLIFAGQHERALEELRISARDYPGAHYALATELAAAGQMAEAAEQAREFIRLMPNDAAAVPARELLARALGSQGQLEGAAEQLTLILQRVPQHVVAHVLLADIRFEQNRLDEAVTHYQSAVTRRPRDPDVLGKLGRALALSGRIGEAIGALERAVVARPSDTVFLTMLGRALAAEGRFSEAVVPFRRVVELSPNDAEAARILVAAEQAAAK